MYYCIDGYKWNSFQRSKYTSCINGDGSMIEMSFNLLNKTLSFKIDNNDHQIAWNNLPPNKYRFAIDMGDENDEIIILEEKIEYINKNNNNNNNEMK